MIERKCPSCGAQVPFRTSILLLAVCPFCRALVRRKDLDVEKLGESAQLQPDGTPIQIGTRGTYRAEPFEVVGRVQLKTPRGFWNEWYLMFGESKQGWLGEAQGTYAVSFKTEATVPALGDLTLGAKVEIGKTIYQVRELVEAAYLAAEGELPFRPPLGEKATSADLIGEKYRFATIDWSETPPAVFTGEYAGFDSLGFTNLKTFEGWTS